MEKDEDENPSPQRDGGRGYSRKFCWLVLALLLGLGLFGFTAEKNPKPAAPLPEEKPPSAIEKLAERGVEANIEAALEAARKGDLTVLGLLQQADVDLDNASSGGSTPLIEATLASSNVAAGWLIEAAGVDLDTPDAEGCSALDRAVAAAMPEQVARLLAAGALPRATDPGEPTLLEIACGAGDLDTVAALIASNLQAGAADALTDALDSGRVSIAKFLLDSISELTQPNLHVAVGNGDIAMAELLIAHGADLDARNANGATPLGAALAKGDGAMTSFLASAGADLDAPVQGDRTPLELAYEKRDRELAALLLDHGAAAHPVMFRRATAKGDTPWMELLAEHGAPLDPELPDGDTLLTRFLRRNDTGRVGQLLKLGADPSRPGKEGQAALPLAIALRSRALVTQLLDSGAEPDATLAHPVEDSFHELASNKTLSFYMKRDSRLTPLMVAAAIGDPDTIRILLAAGASKSKYTKGWKRYPISFASQAKHIEAQQLLVGYDPAETEDRYKIVISLSKQRATLYKNGEVINSSTVSTGKKGYRTPTGEYVVTHKHRHHKSSLYDSAPMPYFMRFSCGAFGTHTGYCPGYPASHGCIRMPNAKAKAFFYTAPTGTPVSIVD